MPSAMPRPGSRAPVTPSRETKYTNPELRPTSAGSLSGVVGATSVTHAIRGIAPADQRARRGHVQQQEAVRPAPAAASLNAPSPCRITDCTKTTIGTCEDFRGRAMMSAPGPGACPPPAPAGRLLVVGPSAIGSENGTPSRRCRTRPLEGRDERALPGRRIPAVNARQTRSPRRFNASNRASIRPPALGQGLWDSGPSYDCIASPRR
jgi:hypothetical protein